MPTSQDTLDALDAFGQKGVAAIVDNIRTLPLTRFGPANASGQLAASVRYTVEDNVDTARLTFYAASYALTLVFGRKPGKFPPVGAILDWIEQKGILPKPDAKGRIPSKQSLAFLIGRAIAEKGTILHQAGSPSKLLEPVTSTAAVQELTRTVLPTLVQRVVSALQEA